MRLIEITEECYVFIHKQDERTIDKFYQLIELIRTIRVVNSLFVKKLKETKFYELRLKVTNEYRIVLLTVDHQNFSESNHIICLNGFMKKSRKDYRKALRKAEQIVKNLNQ